MVKSSAPWCRTSGEFAVCTPGQHCTSAADRRGGRIKRSPAARSYSVVHYSDRYVTLFGYFRISAPVLAPSNDRSVARLLGFCCPLAVLWAVADRVVFSFYRQVISVTGSVRPISKILELVPRFAHSYALAAIVLVARISASLVHAFPARVQSSAGQSVRSCSSSDCRSGRQAAAGFAFAASQVSAKDVSFGAAGAYTAPHSATTTGVPAFSEDHPSTKLLAGYVDESWVSHGGFLGVE